MERFQLSLARELTARGHALAVYALRGDGALRHEFAAVCGRAEVLPPAARGPVGLWWPTPLTMALRAFRADVVHAVSGVWLATARAAECAAGTAMVQAQHGREPRLGARERLVLRLASRRTHAVVAVSDEVAQEAARVAPFAPAPELIANGLPLPALRHGVERSARGHWCIPQDAFVVGCLARFDAVKNLPLLLRGVAALHAARPALNTHLLLAGDGAERVALQQLAQQLGIGSRVHMPGMVSDPGAVLSVFDVCVLTSTTEGTPMSLIEAMALGVPVAASAVGGIPALLEAGAAGRLFPSQDEAGLVQALLSVADDTTGTASRIARARSFVEQTFEIGAVASRYEAVYERALQRCRAARA
jgi:glycosyltransferase involved in cell wall biosynthesis